MLNETIGENIRTLRESAGFSQANIADFLHVDQSFVSKVEKGERSLSTDMLEKIAALFCVTVEAIQQPQVKTPTFQLAFRSNELTAKDLETISVINKIALNSKFMSDLLEAKKVG